MWRRAKAILTDIHGEINIPKEKSKCIAETILPDIIEFYQTEEGKKVFEEWKKKQIKKKEKSKV
jgi:hypothetical protein